VSAAGDDAAPLELLDTYADLLSSADENDRAIEICETIRRRDFAYPGVAEKLETLRAKTATEAEGARTIAAPAPPRAATPAESRYEILGEIGRGGMGVVFRARDTRLGRIIALKRLPENLRENETAVQLFLREARAAAALNHPNIVTLFDADQEDGNYYITMEFLEGMGLDTILTKRGKLSARDSARLGVQIAKGLVFAHERKIVHRDIKTSNLFFTNDKVVKIMDFGLAKMMEEVRRAATVIGGTPYYMAPEQAIGKGVDHRADLYAFGVTLFELMTGTVPFKEGDVTYHHRHTPPPDPRSLVEGIPDGLAEMILALLEKQPDARPGSAADVGAVLAEVIAG
jgi:serine/threonine-protein kinase